MIRSAALILLALLLAGLVGWKMAEPEPLIGSFSGSEALSLPADNLVNEGRDVKQSLETLYDRSAWSAVPPESKGADQAVAEEPAAPEGLDRFRLLGILRVAGVEPEVLLKDLNAGEGRQPVFRAREGESLQESAVVLAQVGQQKIFLEQAGEIRELFLFPRSPTNGRDE